MNALAKKGGAIFMAQSSRVHSNPSARKTWATIKRFGVSKRLGIALACIGLVVALCVGGLLLQRSSDVVMQRGESEKISSPSSSKDDVSEDASSQSEAAPDEDTSQTVATSKVLVHVDGAVITPGVYELVSGSRVCDAVEAAGGLTDEADTSQVNLAAELTDGEKVHIPRAGEAPISTTPAQGDDASSGPININTATAEQLDALPGVGEATATAIIEDREQNGPFASPEDLMRVSGIGEKKYERLEGLICV